MTRYRMPISVRFALVLAVLLPALAAVVASGLYGLRTGRNGAHTLYVHHLQEVVRVSSLQSALQDAQRASLELLLENDPVQRRQLRNQLTIQLVPAVDAALTSVAALAATDATETEALRGINARWAQFEGVLADQLPAAVTAAQTTQVAGRINQEFDSAVASAKSITRQETDQADRAYEQLEDVSRGVGRSACLL